MTYKRSTFKRTAKYYIVCSIQTGDSLNRGHNKERNHPIRNTLKGLLRLDATVSI